MTPTRAALTPWLTGLRASAAIALGYAPIAFSFGIAARQAGLDALLVLGISTFVYAGGSQFVLIGLLTSGAGVLTAVPTIWLLNARHLLYGPALAPQLAGARTRGAGLTDEVFAYAAAQMSQQPPEARAAWLGGVQAGAYAAWVGGTALGVALGPGALPPWPVLQAALQFLLPALFFALLLGMDLARQWPVALVAALAAALALALGWPAHVAVPVALLAGAGWGAWRG
ncbi:MAG: AzlC family ABC transporter permease [Proteobacteria bacterium]|nr:AzlC family ABC transporter permease [Pseudomonadota bacterium]